MSEVRSDCEPILCAHLLRKIDAELVRLLESLRAEEWDLQTIAPQWQVRDVAAHLLDTCLRKLSMVRDKCFVESVRIESPQDLVAFVNRINAEGVRVYRRLSPSLVIEMMRLACEQSAQFHESLDPFAPAAFSVSWAGQTSSANWFDTARELTERWHHQQQIRVATNRPGIMTRELYYPVLDCFMRGMPHAYRNVIAPLGTTVCIEISGDCGGHWYLSTCESDWILSKSASATRSAQVVIPQEIAWQLFTKGIDRESARSMSRFEGDRRLCEAALGLTAIVG
ncbi:MAG TPA: maleylpyruvate isomerase N-terminal domain-containing protein [Terriglobales bacterium]